MAFLRSCPGILGCVTIVALAHHAIAQPVTRLLGLHPPGGRIGTSVTVTVNGQDLDDLQELRFSIAGITAKKNGSNTFNVTIGAEVPLGVYDSCVVGKNGASNPRAFGVGALEEITVEKPPTSLELAKTIPLNSTVNARAEANAVHYFRVAAKKDQRVLVRCDAGVIDSRLEPVLAVLDERGREIDRNRHGGILDFTAPADASFVIKVNDVVYRGGPEFWYRLTVGTFAHVDSVFSPAVAIGKNKVTLFGRNLPGSKPSQQTCADGKMLEEMETEIDIPADAVSRRPAGVRLSPFQASAKLFAFRLNGATEPVLLGVASSPPLAEREPNDTAEQAQKIAVPCEVAGHFSASRDRDWFTFEAKKGEAFWIEVVSHRLGLATDPLLIVQRLSGENASDVLELNDSEANVGGNEFDTRHRDPAGKLEIKEDGTYRVLLRNLFGGSRADARLAYHLAIRKPSPAFDLVALPQQQQPSKKDAKDIPLTPLSLRRSETVPLKIVALRRDGFSGDIELHVDDLPPGLSTAPARIESGKSSALMFFSADGDAKSAPVAITVRGTAAIDGKDQTHVATPATLVWGTADPAVEAVSARLAASETVSIAERVVPVRVHPSSNTVETVAGKTVKVNFLIDREESFSGPVKLKPFGLAALDSVPEVEVDAKATNLVLQIDLREKKVPAGTHVFALQASAQGKPAGDDKKKAKEAAGSFNFYSAPVVLHVNPAPAQTNSPAK